MIRSITIENFKSIQQASLVLPKFGVIIGKNGSGKSTLLYAISLTQKLASGLNLNDSLKSIAPLTNELFHSKSAHTNATIELIVETAANVKYKLIFSIALDEEVKRLIISNESLYRLEGDKAIFVYKRVKNEVITYLNNEELNVPLKTEIDKLALGVYSHPEALAVTNMISNYTVIGNQPERKEGVNTVSGEHPDLKTIDGVVVSLFNKNPDAFQSAVRATQQIIPDFSQPIVGDISKFFLDNSLPNYENNTQTEGMKSYVVSWREKQISKSYTSISLSGGNLRTIYLIFNLFNSPNFSFLAVEEIENGMHLDRVFKLIEQFRTQSYNRKIQMLFTTHSLEVLNYVSPQEMIYCSKTIEEGSKYKLLSDTQEYDIIKNELDRKQLTGKDLMESGLFD